MTALFAAAQVSGRAYFAPAVPTMLVSADLSGVYSINKLVSSDLTGSYSISGAVVYVSADLAGAYGISGYVKADLQGIYSIGAMMVNPAQSRVVKFGGRTRILKFVSTDPAYRGGKYYLTKGENDKLMYIGDVAAQLADASTTASSAIGIAVGVTELAVPIVQGTQVLIKVGGMDLSANAKNSYTIRVTCANGEQFDVTINFERDVSRQSLPKDPDNLLYYGADVADMLTAGGTSASSVDQRVTGVSLLLPAVIQGAVMVVKLGGLDTGGIVDNNCRLLVSCQNGEYFEKAIYFTQQDG